MKTRKAILVGFAALMCSTMLLTGCKSDPAQDVSFRAITGNLTPEMRGSWERPVDVRRNMAVNNNMNWRLASDDLGRVFFTGHPSRLSPMPIVTASGNPR